MKAPSLPRENGQRIEWLLALAVLIGLIYMGWLTVSEGYFPQPFFWDADDTFRDWFSTAIWAHRDGAYDTWLTVYPPLSFAILKVIALPSCYVLPDDKLVRSCDWIGLVAIHGIFILNIILTAITFKKIDPRTALPRAFALTAGMPMIFGLERGNIVLLAFTFILLGFGPLVRSARLRWTFVALAVNLKIYLIAAVFAQLVRRRWMWFEGTVIAIALVYLVSYGIYGAGTPVELYENLVNFSIGFKPASALDIWYPNTYVPLHYLLTVVNAPISLFISSDEIDVVLIFIPLVMHSAQLTIVLAVIATWLRPELVPSHRVTFLALALAMITSEASAYTQPILFFFVFMERWIGWARPLAIGTCYILCIPGDIYLGDPTSILQFSYMTGRYVFTEQGLTLGMFLRPFLLILPAYFLGFLTIKDVWNGIRRDDGKIGWRWRGKRRARMQTSDPSDAVADHT